MPARGSADIVNAYLTQLTHIRSFAAHVTLIDVVRDVTREIFNTS